MSDISNIKPSERITLEIHHPADENELLGIRVFIMSISDPKMKKIKRRIQDDKLRLEARGKYFKSDDLEDNTNAILFSAMLGWEWYNPTGTPKDENYDETAHANFHGNKSPEFNRATVVQVFTELEWFADQVADGISEEKAFFSN